MIRKLLIPFKYRLIKKHIDKQQQLSILDVGCGHNSYEIAARFLQVGRYDGIDKEYYHGKKDDYDKLTNVYLFDLDEETHKLDEVPDDTYDVILMSHVIEHLDKGEAVITEMFKKVKKGGLIYIETPSEKTFNYPSGVGFFNFYDDSTHKRFYHRLNLIDLFMPNGFKILGFGIRKDKVRLFLYSPFYLAYNLLLRLPFGKKWNVVGLWDYFGIAQFLLAKKK